MNDTYPKEIKAKINSQTCELVSHKHKAIFIYTDTSTADFQETRMLISPDCLVCGLID